MNMLREEWEGGKKPCHRETMRRTENVQRMFNLEKSGSGGTQVFLPTLWIWGQTEQELESLVA